MSQTLRRSSTPIVKISISDNTMMEIEWKEDKYIIKSINVEMKWNPRKGMMCGVYLKPLN